VRDSQPWGSGRSGSQTGRDGFSPPPGWTPAHRALRLIMAAGIIGAVVCIVLAGITLVTAFRGRAVRDRAASGPARRAPVAVPEGPSQPAQAGIEVRTALALAGHPALTGRATAPVSPATAVHPPPSPWANARQMGQGRMIASYRGTGPAMRGPFHPGASGAWGILWKYACAPHHLGRLVVLAKHGGRYDDVEVNSSGSAGMGVAVNFTGHGSHSLEIISRCRWAIQIVVPQPGTHARQGKGHRHGHHGHAYRHHWHHGHRHHGHGRHGPGAHAPGRGHVSRRSGA
jgi:hypothetical protein